MARCSGQQQANAEILEADKTRESVVDYADADVSMIGFAVHGMLLFIENWE